MPANADVFSAVASLRREKRQPEIRLRSQARLAHGGWALLEMTDALRVVQGYKIVDLGKRVNRPFISGIKQVPNVSKSETRPQGREYLKGKVSLGFWYLWLKMMK